MRAMILAAGLGTRLRPLTEVLPKPLAPVVHRPLVGYLLHALAAAGVREVLLNLHHLPEAFPRVLGAGGRYAVPRPWSPEAGILGRGEASVRRRPSWAGSPACCSTATSSSRWTW